MVKHTTWVVGVEQADRTWKESDRQSGPGVQIRLLNRVRDGYYTRHSQNQTGQFAKTLLFTKKQWDAQMAKPVGA